MFKEVFRQHFIISWLNAWNLSLYVRNTSLSYQQLLSQTVYTKCSFVVQVFGLQQRAVWLTLEAENSTLEVEPGWLFKLVSHLSFINHDSELNGPFCLWNRFSFVLTSSWTYYTLIRLLQSHSLSAQHGVICIYCILKRFYKLIFQQPKIISKRSASSANQSWWIRLWPLSFSLLG